MSGIVYPADWQSRLRTPVFVPSERAIEPDDLLTAIRCEVGRARAALPARSVLCLSGGVDSSLLAALMPRGSRAITISDSMNHPDAVHAVEVAGVFGLDHEVVCLSGRLPDMYEALFREVASRGFKGTINGDAIDEMQGGYPDHQWTGTASRAARFEQHWAALGPRHLDPMDEHSRRLGVSVALPYLGMSAALAALPMSCRATASARKILLRLAAVVAGVPATVISRSKMGLVHAIREADLRG